MSILWKSASWWKSILKNSKLWLEFEKSQKVIERFFTFPVQHEKVLPLWCCVFKILFLFEILKLEVRTGKKKWNCWQQTSWKSILKNSKLWLELEKSQKVMERFFTFPVQHENVFPLWCCVFKILVLFEIFKLEVSTGKKKWNCVTFWVIQFMKIHFKTVIRMWKIIKGNRMFLHLSNAALKLFFTVFENKIVFA